MRKYIVFWVLLSGETGHGNPLNEATAKAWRDMKQKEYPDDLYWIEPAKENNQPDKVLK